MSLKGYQYFRDNKVIMSYNLKYAEITLYDDVSKKEYDDFYQYLKTQGFEPHSADCNDYKIVFDEK